MIDYINPFAEGQWIRWTMLHTIKEGRVTSVCGPGMVVTWIDGTEQVFPIVEGYLPPYASGEHMMVVIPRPPRASSIERDRRKGVMSVPRAAASLGTTPKRVRAMLRAGQLDGIQRDGKWVSVVLNGS